MLISKCKFQIILMVYPVIHPPTKPDDEKNIFIRAVDYAYIELTHVWIFNYFMVCSALKVTGKVKEVILF